LIQFEGKAPGTGTDQDHCKAEAFAFAFAFPRQPNRRQLNRHQPETSQGGRSNPEPKWQKQLN
jgi:hypothetical protein